MTDVSISKYLYRVYECQDANDYFSYDPNNCLFESDDLGKAHEFAYTKWKLSLKNKVYTIIQPYDGSCRGGYGFSEEDDISILTEELSQAAEKFKNVLLEFKKVASTQSARAEKLAQEIDVFLVDVKKELMKK